jgi:hypothetical protein
MLPDDYSEDASSVNKPYKVTAKIASLGHTTKQQFN